MKREQRKKRGVQKTKEHKPPHKNGWGAHLLPEETAPRKKFIGGEDEM